MLPFVCNLPMACILLSMTVGILTALVRSGRRAFFLTAGLLYPVYPALTLACVVYLCAAVTGACVLTVVFMQKRRELTC